MADPAPPEQPDNFAEHVGIIVKAILAVGSFAVISGAVIMGTADSIPAYYIGFGGIAIGLFVSGAAQLLKK